MMRLINKHALACMVLASAGAANAQNGELIPTPYQNGEASFNAQIAALQHRIKALQTLQHQLDTLHIKQKKLEQKKLTRPCEIRDLQVQFGVLQAKLARMSKHSSGRWPVIKQPTSMFRLLGSTPESS